MVRNPKRKSNPEVSDDDLELQQPSTSKVQRRNDVAGPSVPTTNNTSMNGHAENEFDHISDDEEGGIRIGDIYIPPAPEPTLSMDSKAPRLLIKKIVNEDFKSYKGKVELGPFQKSFTSIIGPNGSGKSNVIDSMLFVFGYRASKIRSKKISSLIHNSEKYPNVKSATVAVHFVQIVDKEGEYDYDELPGTEIVVTRTAHIDNSSYYTLNGRRVQFKAVAKLLKSHGIDLIHNRFLILQGEVEQIAMMKFKGANENETGLLEYLDDIISTVRYKEPLVKIAERTDELTDLRREKLNRVRFVEAEKLQLERPMKDAVDQLNARNNATRARSALLQKYIHEVDKMIKEKTSEYDNLKEEQKKQDGMIKETQAKIEEKQKFLKEQNKKYDKLNNRKEELMTKNKTLKNRDGTITAETNQCNKRKKNVEALLKTENGKLMDLKKIPEKNTREIAECEELDQQLVQKKAALEEKMNTLIEAISSETRGLQEEIHKLKTRLIGLNEIESKAQMKLKLAESELEILLRNETEERNKFEKLTESLSKATKDLTEKKARLTQINTSLPAAEKELTATERQLTALGQELTATNGEVRTLRATLQERRDSVSAANSRNKVLNFIMEQKRIGALPGVYGRMGDLGGIDTKYDVAISTCCGALDNILVDTVDTGVKCIELLKQHNIGKCTFIALEKQEHLRRQAEQRITTPENVPRLFDLIKVTDKRVLPAFYFALRDTLVAHDLEQATRIAYGRVRYRVVSLNGDVIEVAGTMSGGGRSVIRGRMGASVKQNTSQATDPRVLAEQEKKLNDMQDRIKELRETILNLEKKKEDFKKKRDEMRNEKSKLEAEVKHLIEQVPALKNQLKDQESKIKNSTVDPKQKAKLQKAIEIATREHDEAEKNLQELTDQVNEVQGQIKAIAGDRLKKLTKEIAEVTSKIEKVRTEVTKLKVAINASGRNIRNSQQKIGHMETDIKEIDAKLKNLQDETKVNAVEAKKIEKELDEIEESLSEGDTHTELKEELAKLQKRETKLKSLKIDMDNDLDKLKKAISDHKLKMPAWSKELSSLQLEDPNIANFPKPDALETIPAEELEGLNVEELRNKCKVLRDRISDGLLNIGAIKEYYLKEALFLKRAEELEEITGRRNEMRELLAGLRKKRQDEFLASFSRISARVREMYQMITIGGDAELELVDSFDPYSEGVRFNVRPPLKTWKAISNLSGGEKTLSSLALVFALHYYKPSPLYVMDEIDAALDFKNVSIVANYIRERTKNAQFIIISLRYNMFENANRLVGIYKVSDCTGSITIENTPPPPPSSSLERLEKEVEDQTNAASERTVAPLQVQNCNGAISAPNEPELPIELDGVDDEATP